MKRSNRDTDRLKRLADAMNKNPSGYLKVTGMATVVKDVREVHTSADFVKLRRFLNARRSQN